MEHRKDITKYLRSKSVYFKGKNYKVYQHGGLLYMPQYRSDKDKKITNFLHIGSASLMGLNMEIITDIVGKFQVGAITGEQKKQITCICGEVDTFEAYYKDYSLGLKCQCGNEFSAYSG